MEIQKAILDPSTNILKVQVNVLENPDSAPGIADSLFGLLGIGGGDSGTGLLDSIDKILVDVSGALKWIFLVAVLGIAIYFLWPLVSRIGR